MKNHNAHPDDAPRHTCYQVVDSDNVATALDDIPAGEAHIIGPESKWVLVIPHKVSAGHKVALRLIKPKEPITKFGMPIGHATQVIEPGHWIHLHNCASNNDERSQTLDPETGATSDTAYM
jgi:altronate dehydratase small subunit